MSKIESYTRLIENTLARQDFDEDPLELYEPISYTLALGGKRLRPALCLAACELVGGSVDEALMPSLGIELFHNFSLLHDDIMDKAPLRRGRKTVHEKWNLNTAILSGDAMLVKAYELIANVDPAILPRVLKCFSHTAMQVCEGQQYDLNFETSAEVTEQDYLEMIRLKTSVLLGCAMKIGAWVGGAKNETAERLYSFGENIGIAFQIQDDILDSFGKPEKFGKTPGGDILNDKKTLLMISANRMATDTQREVLETIFPSAEGKVHSIKEIFEESGALEYCRQQMDSFYRKALKSLDEIQGDEQLKLELAKFAEWLIKRNF